MPASLETAALPAAPDLGALIVARLGHLRNERKLAALTPEAYGRDVRQFLAFLTERFGAPPAVADFVGLVPGDLRAYPMPPADEPLIPHLVGLLG